MTDWLPPDQIATTGWPVVGERGPANDAPAQWPIELAGQVAHPQQFDLDALKPHAQILTMDVHCVTRWSHRAMRFVGVPLEYLLAQAAPLPAARFVHALAWSDRLHDTSLPLEYARAHCWVVWATPDGPLPPEHGGPVRIVTPGKYFYKSLKWVRRISLLDVDPFGYWEREDGYHNHADPWPGDERYTTGNLTGQELERFKTAKRYRRWHGRTIRRAPLQNWAPHTQTLGPLSLKGCDLRGAQLAYCDLSGANLSLSDLSGANLRGANLRGADVEGARFIGADLRDADLRNTFLTATAFFEGPRSAQVDGMLWQGAQGMLPDLVAWLNAQPTA